MPKQFPASKSRAERYWLRPLLFALERNPGLDREQAQTCQTSIKVPFIAATFSSSSKTVSDGDEQRCPSQPEPAGSKNPAQERRLQ